MKTSARFMFIKENYIAFKNLFKIYQFVLRFLIYAMLEIKSDIVFIILIIFRYAINFIDAHYFIMKRIFKYLRVTIN